MASSEQLTSSEYIKHHLTNLTFGKHPDGTWGIAHGAEEAQQMGFWAFHLDTLGWSLFLGLVFIWLFRKAAKNANAGVPSGVVNFAEWIIVTLRSRAGGGSTRKVKVWPSPVPWNSATLTPFTKTSKSSPPSPQSSAQKMS